MVVNTDRLELYALNAQQMRLWLNDIPALEKELNCSYKAEAIEGFFAVFIQNMLFFPCGGVNWKRRGDFLKQFIYLDTDIVNSIIAQSEKGLVSELSSKHAESNSDMERSESSIGAKVKVGGSFLNILRADVNLSAGESIGSDYQSNSATKEIVTKTLHDAAFDFAFGNIQSEIVHTEIAEIGSYVELCRVFDFVDLEYVLGLFSENGFIELLGSTQGQNSEQLEQIKKLVNAIKNVIPYSRMLISYDGFLVPFEDKYFRVNPKTIGFKYGGEITCIGLITIIIGEDTTPLDTNVFTMLHFQINEVLRKILPTKEKNLYIVHPIAVFYGK